MRCDPGECFPRMVVKSKESMERERIDEEGREGVKG